MAFWATCKIAQPIQPIGQHIFALPLSALKKPPSEFNFFHIFGIPSSSRHEKRSQMLQGLFWLFQCSKNPQCFSKKKLDFRSLVQFHLTPRICRNQFWKIFVNMQLNLKFACIFTYTFILLFSVSYAENCLPLDECESLNQLAEFQSELQNITAESVESYIEEQRCKNTSDVLTYECPEIYDGE